MSKQAFIVELLKHEVRPGIGCTEPVAIALATAYATKALGEEPEELLVYLSKGIYKNAMDVGIPGTDKTGLDVAAALGAALKDPGRELELLGDITDKTREKADEYLSRIPIDVKVSDKESNVLVEVYAKGKNHQAHALIEGRHDRLTELSLDGESFPLPEMESSKQAFSEEEYKEFYSSSIDELVTTIEAIPFEELQFLLDGLMMNKEVAKQGMDKPYGLGVGHSTHKNIEEGFISSDLSNLAYMLTAAASDVRMSGERISVMSSSGSGNNGLTAILPLAALQEIKDLDDDTIVRALAMSHVITSYVKYYIGRLSNLCGCSIAASIGSGSAIAWALGGKDKVAPTINNIIANQAGVICDGAKPGCALKLGTAAMTAVQAALLTLQGTELEDHNGLTDPLPERSIQNLATLSSYGMGKVDLTIIDIMKNRKNG